MRALDQRSLHYVDIIQDLKEIFCIDPKHQGYKQFLEGFLK
jgi:hypothetical protein